MKIKNLMLLLISFTALWILLLINLDKKNSFPSLDTVEVNEIMNKCETNWGYLNEQLFENTSLEFTVLDKEDNVLYSTSNYIFEDMNHSILNRDTMINLKNENSYLGSVIFYNDTTNLNIQYKHNIMLSNLILFMIFTIFMITYLIYMNRRILYPFKRLQGFAENISRGNFDIPLKMEQTNFFGAFTESFDLMRQELKKAKEEERIATQSKQELIAQLSHDIKTPIASIKAIAELMQIQTSDEKAIRQLNHLTDKADQIDLLVSNLFHASLEELSVLKVQSAEEESPILLDLIRNSDYNNVATIDPIPECIILFDKLRLQQVFDNIISNSYKYANTNINVHSFIAGNYLTIEIRDFGPGVPKNEMPILFQKFQRGSNTSGISGSGLGLYISHYLIAQMEGHITCKQLTDGFSIIISLKLS